MNVPSQSSMGESPQPHKTSEAFPGPPGKHPLFPYHFFNVSMSFLRVAFWLVLNGTPPGRVCPPPKTKTDSNDFDSACRALEAWHVEVQLLAPPLAGRLALTPLCLEPHALRGEKTDEHRGEGGGGVLGGIVFFRPMADWFLVLGQTYG